MIKPILSLRDLYLRVVSCHIGNEIVYLFNVGSLIGNKRIGANDKVQPHPLGIFWGAHWVSDVDTVMCGEGEISEHHARDVNSHGAKVLVDILNMVPHLGRGVTEMAEFDFLAVVRAWQMAESHGVVGDQTGSE